MAYDILRPSCRGRFVSVAAGLFVVRFGCAFPGIAVCCCEMIALSPLTGLLCVLLCLLRGCVVASVAFRMLSAIDTNYAEELNKKQTTTRVLQAQLL